jgi:hypothetical protein
MFAQPRSLLIRSDGRCAPGRPQARKNRQSGYDKDHFATPMSSSLSELGGRGENSAARGQIFDDLQAHCGATGQKFAEIWTVQTNLQPGRPQVRQAASWQLASIELSDVNRQSACWGERRRWIRLRLPPQLCPARLIVRPAHV